MMSEKYNAVMWFKLVRKLQIEVRAESLAIAIFESVFDPCFKLKLKK
jgi:hypothetical protein